MDKCKICLLFDCGLKCNCVCHSGITNKIRHDLSPSDRPQMQVITDEDITLVAQQTGVSFETAKRALNNSKGDLAKAILSLNR